MTGEQRCTFWIRPEEGTAADLHPCNRAPAEHPVTGEGRFANHRNFLTKWNGDLSAGGAALARHR